MAGRILSAACVLILGGASIAAAQAAPIAEQGGQADVTVIFSLSGDQVVQYEPVVLRYRITNQTTKEIEVYFGREDQTAWMGLRCTGADGSPIERVNSVSLPKSLVSPGARIRPSGAYEGAIIVQRVFKVLLPGSYGLHISPTLTWTARDKSQEGTVAFSQVLSFEVGGADPDYLARQMDALVVKALSRTQSYASRYSAIEALFSIPESQAFAAWETLLDLSLAQEASLVIEKAIQELVRVGTPAKADLLAEIVWGRYRSRLDVGAGIVLEKDPRACWATLNPGPFILAAAHGGLLNMYWAGDQTLKGHIRDLFINHEGAMPQVKGPVVH